MTICIFEIRTKNRLILEKEGSSLQGLKVEGSEKNVLKKLLVEKTLSGHVW